MFNNSSVNSITFKNLSGGYPNKDNTLHADLKQAGFKTIPYWQKFPKDHVVYLQFVSDTAGDVTLRSFGPLLIDTIVSAFASSYIGIDSRYYYNFAVTLGANYHDKNITFTATQGSDVLNSEPICVRDLTTDIANGFIRYIRYTNLDRNNSDLSDRSVDWSVIDNSGKYMDFFIEAVDRVPNDTDENEILQGSQSMTLISAVYYSGTVFQTGGVPDYLATKLGVVSSLDVFTINSIQYLKPDNIDQENFGGSTSIQASMNLTQKLAIGVNVDDLGIENTDEMEWHKEYSNDAVVANFDIEEPDGYVVSNILVQHAVTSIPAQTITTVGYSIAGDEIGEGIIFKSATRPSPIQCNTRGNFDASSRIYFTFAGAAGYVLRVKVLFQLNDIS